MPELERRRGGGAHPQPHRARQPGLVVDKRADERADELMADVLVAQMDQVPQVDRSDVHDIICSNVAQASETGFNMRPAW